MDPQIRIPTKMSWIRNTALHYCSGELVGVVGAVGMGKSSVLAALLGELEKTGGRIALDRPPQGTRAQRRRSRFLFSHCAGPAATRYARSAAGSGFSFRIALDRPPQGTRAAPLGLVFSFRKLWAAFRIPNSSPDPGRPKLSPKRKNSTKNFFHDNIQG
jgi:ABC-type oligopeptide transport system ATPase subunit